MTPPIAPQSSRRLAAPRRRAAAAFTLVELMISIALVLVLILGINQVFSITSQGVAGGLALSTASRDNRSAQAVFYDDLRNIVMPRNATGGTFDDGVAFVIRSERVDAFRNRADHMGDPDSLATEDPTDAQIRSRDFDENNVEGEAAVYGEIGSPALYNDRSHRVDRLMFFARELYRRQTGGIYATDDSDPTEPYVAPMSSNEAYVWYGHLQLPDFTTTSTLPGEEFEHRGPGARPYNTNRGNAYATDWALGRVVLTMREPVFESGIPVIRDRNTDPQDFIGRPLPPDPTLLDPLERDSGSTGTPSYHLEWSRYDLLATTISEFKDILEGYHRQWLALPPPPPIDRAWYNVLGDARFQANPLPGRPLDARGVARTAPVFLRGCTQFIVEFAGDFVTQDSRPFLNGDPTQINPQFGHVSPQYPPVPDGMIDFVVHFEDDGNGFIDNAAENGTVRRVTRWYGMPRDTNGDGVIPGWVPGVNANQLTDVVPLRDVISSGMTQPPPAAQPPYFAPVGYEIEHIIIDPADDRRLPFSEDYAQDGLITGSRYVASWGPDTHLAPKPRMIRITLALDEPGASMANEQTYEYVIELP